LFSSSQTQRRHDTQKKNQERGGSLLLNSYSALSLLAPTSTFLFQTLFLGIFFFSSIRKGKKNKEKKTIEKKSRQRKELTFKFSLCLLTFSSRFYPPAFALLLQTLFPSIFFFSSRRKEKKNHRKEKKCKEGRELTFKLSFCLLTFDSRFCPPIFAFSIQALSPCHLLLLLLFKQKKKKKKTQKKTTIKKKKKCKERRELTFLLWLVHLG